MILSNPMYNSLSHPHFKQQTNTYTTISKTYLIPYFSVQIMDRVKRMVSERHVVIFSKSSCILSHTIIKSLYSDFGVNPTVYELDEISRGREIEQALCGLGCSTVPAVFVGGELVGGANEIMSLQLKMGLKPMLIKAGALWVRLIIYNT
ncbi:monothiol glutaredoxin-S4-like [Rutidosis leptorrhynchoides]|uniref:monothiol glutaredoxin-S4-like n=1 Tax=Rutidosis leptorrhynchoides TaxID=125765 RepID=UPI003A9A6373